MSTEIEEEVDSPAGSSAQPLILVDVNRYGKHIASNRMAF